MAEALAADIKQNILTCSICLGEYEDPRVLPCYHTFCYGCISNHATRTLTSNRTFRCPICREELKCPAGGLHQLKKNFIFSKTKDIITKQQERQTLEEEQANIAAVTQAIEQMTISCEKHPNNELKYYCEDDDTVVCGDCVTTDHFRHGIVSVNEVAKSNKDKIEAALVKTIKTTNRFKEEVAKEKANETKESQMRKATIKNIKKQAQSMRKSIDQREETLISEVNFAYDNRKKQKVRKHALEQHYTSLQSTCDFAQRLITNGTDSDIMTHTKPLIEKLAEMEKTPVPTPHTPAQISYSPGEISIDGLEAMLGQVTVQLKPPVFSEKAKCVHSFTSNLKNKPMHITGLALYEDQVFVVDHDKTKMFTDDGEFKYVIQPGSPLDVAVSQTGHLYITSMHDKCVKVYSTRGQQVKTIGQGIVGFPRGITLNRQGHVMVCDSEKKSILTFHADNGQLLNTIPLSMCRDIWFITINSVNENIVISEWCGHCVHVLSSTGEQLYQYGIQGTLGSGDGQLWEPQGVCTDSYGHIFIADLGNSRIVALSPQGQFIRYIVTEDDGLERPTALAINPAGQLVVAEQWGTVKTFQ